MVLDTYHMNWSATDLISLTGVTILSPSQHILKDHTITNSTFTLEFSGDISKPFTSLIHKLQNPRGLTLLLADVRFLDNCYGVSFPLVKQLGLGVDNPPL